MAFGIDAGHDPTGLQASLGRRLENLDPLARPCAVAGGADALVLGAPVCKGSYPSLFKHPFDRIAPEALRHKPVLLTATGGRDRRFPGRPLVLLPLLCRLDRRGPVRPLHPSEFKENTHVSRRHPPR